MTQADIFASVRGWLESEGWTFDFSEEKCLLRTKVALNNAMTSAQLIVDVKDDFYLVYVISPVKGVEENLGELMKFLSMANFGLTNGNFELDVSDGEFRYKTFVNCDGIDKLPATVIQDSLCMGCAMMDRYGDSLVALSMGQSTAQVEISKVESIVE